MKQSDVVVIGIAVVTGMADDPAHTAAYAVGVAAFQILETQDNRQATGVRAETMTTRRLLRSELRLWQPNNCCSQSCNQGNLTIAVRPDTTSN